MPRSLCMRNNPIGVMRESYQDSEPDRPFGDVNKEERRCDMRKRVLLAAACVCWLALGAAAIECDIEVLFASPPADNTITQRIIDELDTATDEILIAMHSFTDDELGAAAIRAHERGVGVYVLLDEALDLQMAGRERPKLLASGIPSAVENQPGSLLHRFVVIDRQLVITGSYDWSEQSLDRNFADVVIMDCSTVAQQYVDAFFHISDDLLGLAWELSPPSTSSARRDPCLECLARLNASTKSEFEVCPGVDKSLATLLEEYQPYQPGHCSQEQLATILLGIPGLELPLAQTIIDYLCEGLFD